MCQDSLIDVEALFFSTAARAGVARSLFLAIFKLTRRGGLSKGLSLPACRRGPADGQPALDSFPSTSCLVPLPLPAGTVGKLMKVFSALRSMKVEPIGLDGEAAWSLVFCRPDWLAVRNSLADRPSRPHSVERNMSAPDIRGAQILSVPRCFATSSHPLACLIFRPLPRPDPPRPTCLSLSLLPLAWPPPPTRSRSVSY